MNKKSKLIAVTLTYMAIVNVVDADSGLVEYGSHYYKRYDATMGWHQAKAFCEKKGGYLAVITSSGENAFISTKLVSSSPNEVWLGATDEITEGVWKWVTNEPWKYSKWALGNPDNAVIYNQFGVSFDQDYLVMWPQTDVWDDGGYVGVYNHSTGANMSSICEWTF